MERYGKIAGSSKAPFEVIEHELKKTPLRMVLSFYLDSSPMWVQIKE